MSEWCQVVVQCREEDFISGVLKSHPDLAYDWIVSYIEEDPADYYYHDRAIHVVVSD